MQIEQSRSTASAKGPVEWFINTVRIGPLFGATGAPRAAGNTATFAPGEKHGHDAPPVAAITHIAIQEALDGEAVDWMRQVSDEQYQAKPSPNLRPVYRTC